MRPELHKQAPGSPASPLHETAGIRGLQRFRRERRPPPHEAAWDGGSLKYSLIAAPDTEP